MSLPTLLIVYISLHHCPLCRYCLCPCVTVHNVNIVYFPVPLFIMLILFLALYFCPQRYYCLCPCITVHNCKTCNVDTSARIMRKCSLTITSIPFSSNSSILRLLICQTLYWKFSTHLKYSVSRIRKTNPAQCFKNKQAVSTESCLNALKYNLNCAFNYTIF